MLPDGEEEVEVTTLTLSRTGASEYPHLISSYTIFLSLSNATEHFQRDLKFYGPRYSLVRAFQKYGFPKNIRI